MPARVVSTGRPVHGCRHAWAFAPDERNPAMGEGAGRGTGGPDVLTAPPVSGARCSQPGVSGGVMARCLEAESELQQDSASR